MPPAKAEIKSLLRKAGNRLKKQTSEIMIKKKDTSRGSERNLQNLLQLGKLMKVAGGMTAEHNPLYKHSRLGEEERGDRLSNPLL